MPDPAPASAVLQSIIGNATRYADRAALVQGGRRLSWRELDRQANRVANHLASLGVRHGDKVCVLSPNSIAFVETFLGILKIGGCVVPLPSMVTPDSLEMMINDSGARALFLADQYRDLVGPILENLGGLIEGGRIAYDFQAHGWQDYDAALNAAADTAPKTHVSEQDLFNIIYSSGTTGVPKGITHDHGLRSFQVERLQGLGIDETAISLLSTPLYSNTTLVTLMPTLAAGGCCVLMARFDVLDYLDICQRERVTHTMLVPVQYQRIMAHPDFERFDLSAMKLKLSTSAPLRAGLKRDIAARFPGLMIEIYGLTEGGGSTVLSVTDFPDKLESVGTPGLSVDIRIIDEDGQECPQGVAGEIVGRSGAMMTGYHKRQELTDAIRWRDDKDQVFFRSGDIGYFDEDGFLFLSDRKKDMIISGGLNIYADDLERVLLDHPAIDDVAVIAVPSDRWGETPLGLVVL
ncbi:MAG TPA: 4-coumarate--CoA ligase, partial [Rhodospirillales bacterium]|nr:4-coumarate--CoA ligase [Rhodospirillales bacterium]